MNWGYKLLFLSNSLWEPLLFQHTEFAFYSVNFVLAVSCFSFFTLLKEGLFGVRFFVVFFFFNTLSETHSERCMIIEAPRELCTLNNLCSYLKALALSVSVKAA